MIGHVPQTLFFAYHSQIRRAVLSLQIIMNFSSSSVAGHEYLLPPHERRRIRRRRRCRRRPLHLLWGTANSTSIAEKSQALESPSSFSPDAFPPCLLSLSLSTMRMREREFWMAFWNSGKLGFRDGEIQINGRDYVGGDNTKESRRKLRELLRRFCFTGNTPAICVNYWSLIHHMSYNVFVNDDQQVARQVDPAISGVQNAEHSLPLLASCHR